MKSCGFLICNHYCCPMSQFLPVKNLKGNSLTAFIGNVLSSLHSCVPTQIVMAEDINYNYMDIFFVGKNMQTMFYSWTVWDPKPRYFLFKFSVQYVLFIKQKIRVKRSQARQVGNHYHNHISMVNHCHCTIPSFTTSWFGKYSKHWLLLMGLFVLPKTSHCLKLHHGAHMESFPWQKSKAKPQAHLPHSTDDPRNRIDINQLNYYQVCFGRYTARYQSQPVPCEDELGMLSHTYSDCES